MDAKSYNDKRKPTNPLKDHVYILEEVDKNSGLKIRMKLNLVMVENIVEEGKLFLKLE